MRCFTCGDQGHLKPDCANAKEKKMGIANLIAVNVGDAICNNLVQGIISI